MLTQIIECAPPVQQNREPGPTTELDAAILAALEAGDILQLREITAAVGGSTHKVHARVCVLMNKGLVTRIQNPTGPSRGPGASWYRLVGA